MAGLLERVLVQQDEIIRQQTVIHETLHVHVGSDPHKVKFPLVVSRFSKVRLAP